MSTAAALRAAQRIGGLLALVLLCGMVMANRGVVKGVALTDGVFPILAQGVVTGLLFGLFAVGLVLVYRASRVINFAHGGFFAVAYVGFYSLVVSFGLPYWVGLPLSVVGTGALGALTELVFVRRFFRSARLIVAVVTIGVAQMLGGVAGALPSWIGHDDDPVVLYESPLKGWWSRQWGPINFTGDYLAVVALGGGALLALGLFLRYTAMGIAIRGAAQNGDRASELGVNVRSLSTVVWAVAGVLAGLAAALEIPVYGYASASVVSPVTGSALLIALAAGVVAGMDDLPLTVLAAIGVGLIRSTAFFAFRDTAYVDGVLLVVIVGAFLLRRRRLARTEEAASSTWAATEEMRPIPAELARLAVVRNGQRRFLILLAILVLGFPFVMSPSQTSLGSIVLIDGIVVISLVVLTGWGGQVSLGQYAFVGVGALVGGILSARADLPFLVALIGGGLAGAAVALVLGLTALRVRGLYLAVTTLAFAVVTTTLVLDRSHLGRHAPSRVGRPQILFIDTEDNRAFYYLCLLGLVLAWYAAVGLRRTRTGRVLIAMRDNERAAQAFGVNLVRTRLITFAISGFMAAAAGVLFVAHEHAVDAPSFGPEASIQIFLTAVIGGLGSIQGALLGALYFAVVNFTIQGDVGRLFASAFGVLLVLYAFPGGLGAMAYALRDAVLRRIAIRRRIWVPSLLADSAMAQGADKAPIAPKVEEKVPVVYRQRSRVRTAGLSQAGPRWRY